MISQLEIVSGEKCNEIKEIDVSYYDDTDTWMAREDVIDCECKVFNKQNGIVIVSRPRQQISKIPLLVVFSDVI